MIQEPVSIHTLFKNVFVMVLQRCSIYTNLLKNCLKHVKSGVTHRHVKKGVSCFILLHSQQQQFLGLVSVIQIGNTY